MARRKPVLPTQLELPLDAPLRTAVSQVLVERETDGGVICPCCGLLAKVHPRQVTSTMARVLIALAQHRDEVGDEWVLMTPFLEGPQLPTSARRGGDWSKPKYWGLLESHPEQDLWRISDRGYEFVHARLAIPKVLKVYNDLVIGVLDATPYTIHQALGKRFRLEDLYELLGRQQSITWVADDPGLDDLLNQLGWRTR